MGKVLDGIIGLTVGDALGVPVEFTSKEYLYLNPVNDMTGFGTYNQPVGTWSDDSSLTFALMSSLLKGYSLNDISTNYLAWYREARWTPHKEVFDISITMRESLINFEEGVLPTECGVFDEYDNGNVTLMRLLPMAYYLKDFDNLEKRYGIIKEFISFTNKTNRFFIASCIYLDFAIALVKGFNKDDAYDITLNNIEMYFENEEYKKELKHFARIIDKSILIQNSIGVATSGYIIDSLESVLWCLFTTDSYKSCILKAVNMSADTDTIGAITGALAGIVYGYEEIPKSWIEKIIKKDEIILLINSFEDIYE